MNPWDNDPIVSPIVAQAAPATQDQAAATPMPWDNDPIVASAAPTPADAAAAPLTIKADPPAPSTDAASAAVSGAINGIPIAGPYALSGLQHLSAWQRSMDNGTSFDDELAKVQGADTTRQTDHPYATTAGNVAGGIIGTAPLIAAAPAAFGIGDGALAARALTGAGTGAVLGGADAGARSQGQNAVQVARDVAGGAGLGAAGGMLAPAVGSALGSTFARLAGAPVQEAQGVPAAARQYFMDRVASDGGADAVQARLASLGDQAVLPDAGAGLQSMAKGLATKVGPANQIVMDALTERNLGANARLGDVVDAQLGPAQSPTAYSSGLLGQAGDLGRQRAQILNTAPQIDIAHVVDHIDDAISRTAPNSPQRSALQEAKGYLTVTRDPVTPALSPTIGQTPAPIPGGTFPISDATQLHSAKQALDNAINYDAKGLAVPNSAVNGAQNSYKSIRAGLNDAMRNQIPGYAANQDATSALMRQQGNVLDGTKDLRAGMAAQRPDDYAGMFGSLSPPEQDARRVGMRSAVDQALGTKANDLQALKTLTQGDQGWNAQNLGTAFGPDQTAALNKAIDAESKFRETYGKVLHGSETARNLAAEKALQDAEYDPFQIHSVHNLTMEGIAATAAAKPINAVLRLFQRPVDNTARDLGLAKLSTAQGPDRDALLAAVLKAHNAVGSNAALGVPLAHGVTAAGAASPAVLAAVLRGRQQGSTAPR